MGRPCQIRMIPFFIAVSFFSFEAQARPTREQKAERRNAFWGVFSDLYRASGCLGFRPADVYCANQAISDALTHSATIERSITEKDLGFSRRLVSVADRLQSGDSVGAAIESKSFLRNLMTEFTEASAPVVQPDKKLGQQVYGQYCQSCHGDELGNPGKLTVKLKRVPPAFNRSDRFTSQFPFGIYSTMIHGVDNGEMTSLLDVLTVDELWAVAFYVAGLPHETTEAPLDASVADKFSGHQDSFALSALAMSTDQELIDLLLTRGFACGECRDEVGFLRTRAPWLLSTIRLSQESKAPRSRSEDRALILLLVMIVVVSGAFIYILKRTGRVDGS